MEVDTELHDLYELAITLIRLDRSDLHVEIASEMDRITPDYQRVEALREVSRTYLVEAYSLSVADLIGLQAAIMRHGRNRPKINELLQTSCQLSAH